MQHYAILALSIVCLCLSAYLVNKGHSEMFEYTKGEQGKMCDTICSEMSSNQIWGGQETYARCMQKCPTMFAENVWVPGVYLSPK